MANSLTCQEVIEFVVQYLDGELTSEVHETFAEHLERCTACVAYIDSYEKAVALGKAAYPEIDEVIVQISMGDERGA